jgi:hypothetical protein
MSEHRDPQDRVSNDLHPDKPESFDPADALERLHQAVVDLEALANAACEAVTQLPFPADREQRVYFDRAYALVSKVAQDASATMSRGYEMLAELAAHLKARTAST